MLYEHNKEVFENLERTLFKNGSCCVVMGTGVGKTYVTSELLDKYHYRALIVSPRNSINEAWEKHTARVETITYQKLANIYREIDFSKYNVVVCDEVHHIGAPKWGKPIKYLIDNKVTKVIGLTESSVRYTDGGRDVAEEFFYGNVAFGVDVPTAIEQKILNPVTYVGAMYNSEGLKKTLRGKIQSRLYAKLNLVLNNTPTVNEIIKKNMPSGKRKGIIFASTISDMKYAADFVRSVYPNVEIRYVHSKQSDAYNEANMEWFKGVDEGYLCSVDMISEGVHIKGVNTLIMLRRTESVNLFNQQLGRCLDANSKEPAILFDLVNNQYSVHIVKNKIRIKTNSIFKNSGALNVVESQQMIVKDYRKNIVDVLNEIKESLDCWSYWTEEEDNILRKYYPVEFSNVAKRLPHHTPQGCKYRAAVLGLTDKGLWTKEEDDFLRSNYKKMSLNELAQNLGRTKGAVSTRLRRLNVIEPTNFWTKEEDELIRKYYPVEGCSIYKRLNNRTKKATGVHARELGVIYNDTSRFSKEEIEFIKNNFASLGPSGCGKKLGRTAVSVKNLVYRRFPELRYENVPVEWSEEEIAIVREFYPKEGKNMVCRLPNRTLDAIIYIAKKLKIKRDKKTSSKAND